MLVHPAEESFQSGLESLELGRHREALAYFNGAIEIEKRLGQASQPQARYLSYYGLCLSLTGAGSHEAVRFCRIAAETEGYRTDVCWNLGRVLLAAGRRREAHQALRWGLRLQPDHKGIRHDLRRMGSRRPPVLPFLRRTNPINRFLGRLAS
jgi:tetratricopeptide (TPR) repeat protein